jgi:excisionase family DNA binding protein
MPQMLKVKEAAKQLGVAEKTVWTWIYERRNIGFVRLGRSIRISQTEIDKFIAAGTIPAKKAS